MNKRIKIAIVAFGAASAVAAAADRSGTVSAALAAAGGSLLGASGALQLIEDNNRRREEAVRVATAFRYAYEKNRGLVLPEELSLHGEIDRQTAESFLDSLAKEQSGEVIPVDRGVAYKFPHASNVLDVLTKNAQAWAEAQTTALKQENDTLKQQLLGAQQQLRLYQTVSSAPVEQVINKAQAALKDTPKDPWNNLL